MIRRNRALGACVGLAYLLGYLLVFVHFVAEQHAVCAEHGGAHHVEVSDTAEAPLTDGITALPSIVDDHCHELSTVRDAFVFTTSIAIEVPPVADVPSAETTFREEPRATTKVWRYAPKQSPPTA